jgi:hypothetical protein
MHANIQKISKYRPSIFQGHLNLAAAQKPRVALAVEYPVERVILRSLVAVLILLAMCYLYFVSSSIINIMARKEAMARSGAIVASIGSLEGQYFTLTQSITPQSAVAIGLSPISTQNTAYVERPGNVGMAGSVTENRI